MAQARFQADLRDVKAVREGSALPEASMVHRLHTRPNEGGAQGPRHDGGSVCPRRAR